MQQDTQRQVTVYTEVRVTSNTSFMIMSLHKAGWKNNETYLYEV